MNEARPAALAMKILFVAVTVLPACSRKPPPPPQGPPEVGVMTLRPGTVTLSTELPGRTVAYRIAEVRPQVSGVILRRLFVEGSEVKAGQQLYQIDPAPFQANLESAQASLAHAQASLVSAKLLSQRYKPLAEAHAVSQQSYDNAVSSEAQAAADVGTAVASVDTAKINLRYTRVLSPISGRTGRSLVTEGALVASTQTADLVVVQQLDPIYVDVNQPSTVMLRLRRALASGGLQRAPNGGLNTRLTLEDKTPYPQDGRLQFAEVSVDSSTATVTLRAVFPNPDRMLLPGMFVHELVDEGTDDKALLVPQQAVTHNQRGDPTALVVGDDNKVQTRVIKTERALGDKWLVSDGLAPGERVVVVGFQRIKPGATDAHVKPHEVSAEELKGQSAAANSPSGNAPAARQ